MGPECSEAPEGDTQVSLVPYQTRQPPGNMRRRRKNDDQVPGSGSGCAGSPDAGPRRHGSTGWCGPFRRARSGGRRTRRRGVRSGNRRQDWCRYRRGAIRWSGGPGARPVPGHSGIPERSALGFQSSTPGGSGNCPTGGDCPAGGDCPTGGDRFQAQRLSFRRMESPSLGSHFLPIGSRPPEPTMSPALARMDRLMQ